MKKITLLVIILSVISLSACQGQTPNNGKSTQTTQMTTIYESTTDSTTQTTTPHETTAGSTTQTTTVQSSTTTSDKTTLPTYVSGSIEISDTDGFQADMAVNYSPSYRQIYYVLPQELQKIVGKDVARSWIDSLGRDRFDEEPTEMYMVSFIKHFNISKEVFEQYVEEDIQANIELGLDMKNEWYETPNPDIIYTFDNAIINEYYRRE